MIRLVYRILKYLNDLRALMSFNPARIARRIVRRVAGRATGRGLKKLIK